MSSHALEEIGQLVGAGAEADDVLRAVVEVLAAEPGVRWAGILFLEEGKLVLGPEAGTPDPDRRVRVPVSYDDVEVGELAVDGILDPATGEGIARLISTHVLLGWDTGGIAWEP